MRNNSKSPLGIVIPLILVVVLGSLLYMNLRDNNIKYAILSGIALLLNVIMLVTIFVHK